MMVLRLVFMRRTKSDRVLSFNFSFPEIKLFDLVTNSQINFSMISIETVARSCSLIWSLKLIGNVLHVSDNLFHLFNKNIHASTQAIDLNHLSPGLPTSSSAQLAKSRIAWRSFVFFSMHHAIVRPSKR